MLARFQHFPQLGSTAFDPTAIEKAALKERGLYYTRVGQIDLDCGDRWGKLDRRAVNPKREELAFSGALSSQKADLDIS